MSKTDIHHTLEKEIPDLDYNAVNYFINKHFKKFRIRVTIPINLRIPKSESASSSSSSSSSFSESFMPEFDSSMESEPNHTLAKPSKKKLRIRIMIPINLRKTG